MRNGILLGPGDPCTKCGGKIDFELHSSTNSAKRICPECGWTVEIVREIWQEVKSYYDKRIVPKLKQNRGIPCPYCHGKTHLRKIFYPLWTAAYWCPNCHKETSWTRVETYTFPRKPPPPPPPPKCRKIRETI